MQALDTKALRQMVRRAHLVGSPAISFPLEDVQRLCDEVDGYRSALIDCAALLERGRTFLRRYFARETLEAERKRMRDDLPAFLGDVDKLLDDAGEGTPGPEHVAEPTSAIVLPQNGGPIQ